MKKISVLLLVFFCFNKSYGSELLTTAAQLEKKIFHLSVYYAKARNQYDFRVSNNVFGSEGEDEKIVLKWTYNVGSNFYPWVKIGTSIGEYKLVIPSYTATNYYSGSKNNLVYGIGIKILLFPDTVVSPALSLEVGCTSFIHEIDKLYQNNSSIGERISYRLKISEKQGAILVSKRFSNLEPYSGFRIFHKTSQLRDENSAKKVNGEKDGCSLFFGLKMLLYRSVRAIFEIGSVGETILSVGLSSVF